MEIASPQAGQARVYSIEHYGSAIPYGPTTMLSRPPMEQNTQLKGQERTRVFPCGPSSVVDVK